MYAYIHFLDYRRWTLKEFSILSRELTKMMHLILTLYSGRALFVHFAHVIWKRKCHRYVSHWSCSQPIPIQMESLKENVRMIMIMLMYHCTTLYTLNFVVIVEPYLCFARNCGMMHARYGDLLCVSTKINCWRRFHIFCSKKLVEKNVNRTTVD